MKEQERRLFYKVTELEVTGETTFICRHEFNLLKELIEEGGKSRYSIRECADKPGYCETFIIK